MQTQEKQANTTQKHLEFLKQDSKQNFLLWSNIDNYVTMPAQLKGTYDENVQSSHLWTNHNNSQINQ